VLDAPCRLRRGESDPAVAAGAAQDDVVLVERIAVPARDPVKGRFEVEVVEGVNLSALATDEVVVMLAPGMSGLETR
jgi:hypothetical protein